MLRSAEILNQFVISQKAQRKLEEFVKRFPGKVNYVLSELDKLNSSSKGNSKIELHVFKYSRGEVIVSPLQNNDRDSKTDYFAVLSLPKTIEMSK